ncbi:MAG: A/G-specific adenine glycosylase [Paludibacteraceae bacterium]|nr:A/G-specific adenine glycosylase [Paludibacteraceae bacterium]
MNIDNFRYELYQWYEANKRLLPWRETQDPYKIWLSEIILQQTRVAQGLDYYLRFIDRFPTVQDLAAAEEDEVLLLWQGLGYYSRARNLHKAAIEIVESGEFRVESRMESLELKVDRVGFPKTFEELRQLPGVGDYTAGAIASFAYNMPFPAMDGNVYRVLSRIYDDETVFDTEAGKRHFRALDEQLLDQTNPRLFNSAIMEFGALYCVPQNPECEQCPLQRFCLAYAHHTVELLPLRKPKNELKDRYLNYIIYLDKADNTLIHQRTEKDIWQHLWEFVLTETQNSKLSNKTASLNSIRLADRARQGRELSTLNFTHILSHQRIHASFSVQSCSELPTIENTKQVAIKDLDNYAFSRLTLKALQRLFH